MSEITAPATITALRPTLPTVRLRYVGNIGRPSLKLVGYKGCNGWFADLDNSPVSLVDGEAHRMSFLPAVTGYAAGQNLETLD